MDKNSLIQRLMATFVGELQEHARTLEGGLLALEGTTEPSEKAELTKTLFRTAHSLKGAARSVNIAIVETACHQLEEVFAAVQAHRLRLDRDLFEVLLSAADAIRETGVLLEQGKNPASSSLTSLMPRLIEIGSRAAASLSTTGTPESSEPTVWPGGSDQSPTVPEQPSLDTGPQPGYRQEKHVRLTTHKLDHLLAESTGLLLTRHRLDTRLERLEALRESCRHLRARYPRAPARTRNRNKNGQPDALTERQRGGRRVPLSGSDAADLLARCREDLESLERGLDELLKGFKEDCRALQLSVSGLDAEVHRARMVPFSEACDGFSRMVRDLCAQRGKAADLVIKGGDIEIDRAIVELLRDPLRHLVRNAVDHGLEHREERHEAGKREAGRITIQAALRGANLEITVADDGRGLAMSSIRDRAARMDLGSEGIEEAARHIFSPGFSTASDITELSGRGIGLDVVKTEIEAMRGAVDLVWEPGHGTRFVLSIPLTLATIRALLVEAGGQTFAIDSAGIRRVIRVEQGELQLLEGRPTLVHGAASVPVALLSELLDLPPRNPASSRNRMLCVILAAGARETALVVDALVGERQLVAKSVGPRLAPLKQYSGGTILPDGTAALILNSAHLVDAAHGQAPGQRSWGTAELETARRKHILVADDSVTTRAMEQSILEAAGYAVTAAVDGADAWRLLQQNGADLLVADVEMPRMDGFSLAETVRKSERFVDLPIILVTARESDEDRARGLHAGVNAYLGKSAFDQQSLLDAISQFL